MYSAPKVGVCLGYDLKDLRRRIGASPVVLTNGAEFVVASMLLTSQSAVAVFHRRNLFGLVKDSSSRGSLA